MARTAFWCCLDLLEHLDPDERARVSVRDETASLAFELAGRSRDGPSRDLSAAFESLRERVEALSGRLTMEPGPAGSVRVAGSLPLSRRS